MLAAYLAYQARVIAGVEPTRLLPWGDRIGGFLNFSEYYSAPNNLSAAEARVIRAVARYAGSARNSNKGRAVIDVGANLGVVTLLLARTFSDACVIAFEPAESTMDALRSNLARNNCAHVSVERKIVADETGTMGFESNLASRANASIDHSPAAQRIEAIALDDYCEKAGIAEIQFLKVDTEGFECRVFEGARTLLDSERIAVVYYEFCPAMEEQAGFDVGTAFRYLDNHGYRSFRLTGGGQLQETSLNALAGACLENLVAVPLRAAKHFRESMQALADE